jgi:hypothetical protein
VLLLQATGRATNELQLRSAGDLPRVPAVSEALRVRETGEAAGCARPKPPRVLIGNPARTVALIVSVDAARSGVLDKRAHAP